MLTLNLSYQLRGLNQWALYFSIRGSAAWQGRLLTQMVDLDSISLVDLKQLCFGIAHFRSLTSDLDTK